MERNNADADRRDDDAQLAFVYQEAVRGLVHQQNVVESLNTRAGNLIFATAFATSLLGTRALQNGLGLWDWIAVASLLLIGALIAVMLWPYYNLTFRFDPEELLARYVTGKTPAPMPVIPQATVSKRRRPCEMFFPSIERPAGRAERRRT